MYISTLLAFGISLAPLLANGCSPGSHISKRQASANTLSVKLEAPSSVPNLDALVIKTLVTNTGSKPLKVLTANSPLSSVATRDFTFTGVNGTADGTFGGIQLILTMDDPNITNSFVDIAPGATITTEHPAGVNYDLTVGSFSVQSSTQFFSAELGPNDPTPKTWAEMITQDVKSDPVMVTVQGVKRRWVPVLHSRAAISCPDRSRQAFIEAAYGESKQLATVASSFIKANPTNALVTTYFGTATTASVTKVFDTVANEAGRTAVGCTDSLNACEGGVIAYTVTRTGSITMCDIFFQEVSTNQLCTGQSTVKQRNVAAGTVLHEFTHSLSKTDDLGYGVTFDKSLAATPSRALNNADSYNVLATEIFVAAGCNSSTRGSTTSTTSTTNPGNKQMSSADEIAASNANQQSVNAKNAAAKSGAGNLATRAGWGLVVFGGGLMVL